MHIKTAGTVLRPLVSRVTQPLRNQTTRQMSGYGELPLNRLALANRALVGKDFLVRRAEGLPTKLNDAQLKKMQQALFDSRGGSYTPSSGLPPTKESIQKFVTSQIGLELSDDEVMVTQGNSGGLMYAIRAYTDGQSVGDSKSVTIFGNLGFPPHYGMVMAGNSLPTVEIVEDSQNKISASNLSERLQRIPLDKKIVLLINPSAPTGDAYSQTELLNILRVCKEEGAMLLVDAMYAPLMLQGTYQSALKLAKETPELEGVKVIECFGGKPFGLSGFRVGFMAGDPEIIADVNRLFAYPGPSVAHISQQALGIALDDASQTLPALNDELRQRRTEVLAPFESLGFVQNLQSEAYGGPYALLRLPESLLQRGISAERFCDVMQSNNYLLGLPGSLLRHPVQGNVFYEKENDRYKSGDIRVIFNRDFDPPGEDAMQTHLGHIETLMQQMEPV